MAAVFGDDNGDGGGATRRKPVAPSHNKSRVIAESAAGKIVLATAPRNRRTEFSHRRGAEKCVESAGDPHTDKQPCVRKTLRNFAGRSNDSRSNRISDSHSHSEPHAENLEKAAATGRGREANCGRGFRCARQC